VNKAVFEQTTVKPEKFPYATTNRRGTTKTQAQLFPLSTQQNGQNVT
jgi:hypothetical protein